MKKVLFTLATLFLALSASAECKIWFEETHITADQIGKAIKVPVHVTADGYFNTVQFLFTADSTLTVTKCARGADAYLTYIDADGETVEDDPATFTLGAKGVIGYAPTVNCYDENGNKYGSVKWAPGTYDEMALLTIKVTADAATFKEGIIHIDTCSLGAGVDTRTPRVGDPNGEIPANKQTNITWVAGIDVKIINDDYVEPTPEPVYTSVPTINVEGDYSKTVTIVAPEDAEGDVVLEYSLDGETWTTFTEALPFTEAGEYTVYARATETGKETSEVVSETFTVTVQPTTEAPVINVEQPEDQTSATVTITGEGKVEYSYNGTDWFEYTEPLTVTEVGEYTVYARATKDGEKTSAVASKSFEVKEAVVVPETTDAPGITYTTNDDNTVATVVIDGKGTVEYSYDGTTWFPYDGELTVTGEGKHTVYARATEDGKETSTVSEVSFVLDAEVVTPTDPHATGKWLVLIDADGNENYYELLMGTGADGYTTLVNVYYGEKWGTTPYTIDVNEKGDTTITIPNPLFVDFYYVIDGVKYYADKDGNTKADTSTADNNPLTNTKDYYYEVEVGYAWTFGLQEYTDGTWHAFVTKGSTAVNELNADKAVASTRYFNVAGQEMSEAQGITIVVTTYTDGTMSTTKVMK